jgi:hypothetical protein
VETSKAAPATKYHFMCLSGDYGRFGIIDRHAVSKYSTAVGRSLAFTERKPDGVLYENLTLDVLNMPHRFCGSSLIAGFVETHTALAVRLFQAGVFSIE